MKKARTPSTAWICLALTVCVTSLVGCGMPKASDLKPSNLFSLDNSWPFRDADKPKEGMPLRVVGTWTDTVMTQPGQKPQRGFGGRLVFYGPDEKKPILVDGQLVVYAFEETDRDPTDNKPTRRYVFPPDQIPLHMSESEIGVSYSFWLPWDEAGGPKTEVSLICRFEPKGGAVIASEQTRHMLPGTISNLPVLANKQPPRLPEGVASTPALPSLQSIQESRRRQGEAQQAIYESPTGAPSSEVNQTSVVTTSLVPERKLGVTSIRLPDNFTFGSAAGGAAVPAIPKNTTAPQSLPVSPATQSVQQQMPAPSPQPATTPNSAGGAATPPRPATASWPTHQLPAAQSAGFGAPQLVQPNLITPQLMQLQTASPTATLPTVGTRASGISTTVSYPAAP